MTEDQIKHMVSRFLSWKLPEAFSPDGGISFKAEYNEHTPWPARHEPSGTNLFDASQAEAMVRHMLEDMPAPSTIVDVEEAHKDGVSFGIALSIAFMLRDRDEPVIAKEWWDASGLKIEDLERIGVDEYDLDPIRAALATAAEAVDGYHQ